MPKPALSSFCAKYQEAVELIGRRWNGAIVRMLVVRPHRFAELAAGIPDISDRMLAERLRELEAAQVVVRNVIPESPVRVEYALTSKGRDLEGAIRALAAWADKWMPENESNADEAAPSARRSAG
jgi:DNA-binding HxlR family transcriptional regulator